MNWILTITGAALVGLSTGCKTGAPAAMTNIGSEESPPARALPGLDPEMIQRAEAGDLETQYRVGAFEEQRNAFEAAAGWYERAAAAGHPAAQDRLGVLYAKGQGVDQNHATALDWFRKSAEQGHPSAYSNLGLMYMHGRGEPADLRKARESFTKAAELGDSAAQVQLGRLFEKGELVPKNSTEAYQWYRKAAEQNDAEGQNAFAWLLATSPADSLRNGLAAVQYATLANEQTRWGNSQYLATLAAAYAEAGQFEEAVLLQNRVVEQVSRISPVAGGEMLARLNLYTNGKPYRTE